MAYAAINDVVSIVVNEAKISVVDDLLAFLEKKSKNNSKISELFGEFKTSITTIKNINTSSTKQSWIRLIKIKDIVKEKEKDPIVKITEIVEVPVVKINEIVEEKKVTKGPVFEKKKKYTSGKVVYLNCTYEDKDECKELGGRWNHEMKKWYVPQWIDPLPFKKWFLKENIVVKNPFFKPIEKKIEKNKSEDYVVDAETMKWFLKFTA
jgi:hypothetical protein